MLKLKLGTTRTNYMLFGMKELLYRDHNVSVNIKYLFLIINLRNIWNWQNEKQSYQGFTSDLHKILKHWSEINLENICTLVILKYLTILT